MSGDHLPPDTFKPGAAHMKPPAPPRVRDRYAHWGEAPPELSPRVRWWVARIEAGWRPGRFIRRMGYDEAAEYYGVWIWEYQHVLRPYMLELGAHKKRAPSGRPAGP